NCRGKVYQVLDAAGLITNVGINPLNNLSEGYDFKGNLLRSRRQLLQDYKDQAAWSQNPALGGETYTNSSRYDALNRDIQQIAPHSDSAGTKCKTVQPHYNEANLLETLDTWREQTAEPGGLWDPSGASFHTIINIDY